MKVIKSTAEQNRESARITLEGTLAEGFDAVVVVGFRQREQTVQIMCSKNTGRLELIGALREAEHHLLVNGDPV